MAHTPIDIELIAKRSEEVLKQLGQAVDGQQVQLRHLWSAMLTGGHVIVEGVPGLGKTLMARALGTVVDASFARIQFTPDLMPSDVTGTQVFEGNTGSFRFKQGPLFSQIVLADEINRTPPKTQAALLEAMEEGQVSVDGEPVSLPQPFFVIATQNPVEYEGTYPLPEAQLDRFAMKLVVDYPNEEDELRILRSHHFVQRREQRVAPLITPKELLRFRDWMDQIHAEESVLRYIAAIIRETREHPQIMLGASPRAGISLLSLSRASAAMDGRDYVTPDDVKGLVEPVLRHRLLLKPDAELEGMDADDLIREILRSVSVPR
ncbi:AAA family ATPase [Marininema halotolerans]|uniref:MoxR-like ATPase n=1 Tax=Marininema halotolerans TaxID=1155944 RepID=A0A1I6R8N9_9BACL|nr:MoxR family ATPase [Marininema halotolerans]SFS60910.1 MoxR-like ATPase [Marininema halotolerans]